MIFVTVGTHEQPFNRLIEEIDKLKENETIADEVIIQKGYSTYVPKYCKCYDFLPYEKMIELQNKAKIIITHGGPSSFMYSLSIGKTPIVVPRQKQFGEHVNNHQLEFCEQLSKKNINMILIKDTKELSNAILSYTNISLQYSSNNTKFNEDFECLIKLMF